jgi:hypothetical protein
VAKAEDTGLSAPPRSDGTTTPDERESGVRAKRSRCGSLGAVVGALFLAACGGGGDPADPDAPPATPDAPRAFDAAMVDAGGVPLAGFGDITGMCGVIADPELDGTSPLYFAGELAFQRRYDDPADRDLLTPGGLEIILDGNAGGSSVYSEAFAMEWLARCELATLIKTETEIVYDDPMGKKADILIDVDGRKVGVSVTRAVTFPFGNPYTLDEAILILDRKLDDIQLATAAVSAGDLWTKQMLSVLAYDQQHADVAMQAWSMLDAETRDDTIVIVTVTSGDDLFIYTDS